MHPAIAGSATTCVAFFIAVIPAEIITDWILYKDNRSTLSAILLRDRKMFLEKDFHIAL